MHVFPYVCLSLSLCLSVSLSLCLSVSLSLCLSVSLSLSLSLSLPGERQGQRSGPHPARVRTPAALGGICFPRRIFPGGSAVRQGTFSKCCLSVSLRLSVRRAVRRSVWVHPCMCVSASLFVSITRLARRAPRWRRLGLRQCSKGKQK